MMPSPPAFDGPRPPPMSMLAPQLPPGEMQNELATFAAEMISYIWFAPPSTLFTASCAASLSPISLASPSVSPLDQPLHAQMAAAAQQRLSTTTTASLQPSSLSPLSLPTLYSPAPLPAGAPTPPRDLLKHILPSPQFLRFVAYVLQTTQVGQAAVLLSILYLERYRRVCLANAKAAGGRHHGGNVNRLFVTSLVLANKTLDDNTFTNATWASISGLPLVDINSMERQFLAGIGFHLHVTPAEYRAWITRLWELNHSRRETIRSFSALRAQQHFQQQQQQSRPMSGESQSSRPPSFGLSSGQLQLQQHQPYQPLQTYAPPLFGAPPMPLEGYHLHPSYLPHPVYHTHPPPSGLHLPPPPAGGAIPSISGQVTPRASFDGSASFPMANLNPTIATTPASHRLSTDGLLKSASPSSRHQVGGTKRGAAEAFSPSDSPLTTALALGEARPSKRMHAASTAMDQLPPPPLPGLSRPPSLTMPWAPPQATSAPNPSSGEQFGLPSLNPPSSPMQILGQPWVFEGHDAMGTTQLFVCSLMADGPRRYQLVQQQRSPMQPSSAPGYAPLLVRMPQALPGGQQYPPPSASSLVGQHSYSAPPSSMLPPPPLTGQPAYHSHLIMQQPPPSYAHPLGYYQHQRAQPLPPPQFPPAGILAFAHGSQHQQHALPRPLVSQASATPAQGLSSAVKISPARPAAPDVVVEHADAETAKRNRVERWRRDVSASSGGDY